MNNHVEFLESYKNKQLNYFDIVELIRINDIEYKSFMNSKNNELFSYNIKSRYNTNNYDKWKEKHEIHEQVFENQIEIHIDSSFNSLEDLIEITNQYTYKPLIKYNIDLKSLHNIKDELVLLNNMIGLESLKKNIVDQILYFLQKLHINNDNHDYKHTIICGAPGTGKTEVAEILGKMYSKMDILKNNIFKKVTRSDLIAGYLGQTALKTKALIQSCLGGCIFIDEAYALGSLDDSFSRECIDTLNESLSHHKSELMVIIAGYEEDIKQNLFSMNKGLESRFMWSFNIDSYNYVDLYNIFIKKVDSIGWSVDKHINEVWFRENYKEFPCFGRDIEKLLYYVKIKHSRRVFGNKSLLKIINLEDMKNGLHEFLSTKPKKNTYNHYI